MTPSPDSLEDALRSAVEEVYKSEDQNNLTVRFIRDKVENGFGLDQGYFLKPEWKDKSKLIIKLWAAKLIDDDEIRTGGSASIEVKPKLETKPSPTKKSESPAKKGTKQGSRETKNPPKKHQKKEETPSEDEISRAPTEDSVISDFKDSEDSDSPKARRKANAKPRTRAKPQSTKRAKVESDESESEDISQPKQLKRAKKEPGERSRLSKSKIESDEESEEGNVSIKASSTKTKSKTEPAVSEKLESADEKSTIKVGYVDSDSEAPMMIDEDVKPKPKKRSKSEASSSAKAPKSKAAPKELSPDEAQIKTLQSQLTKCGVRKIWGIVLKQFGDDNKQKIRHLQGLLRDVGMTGRFSDQRAKEIKELRELQADLEAVKQGDTMWGMQTGRRARGQRKILKEDSAESNDEDNDDGESDRKRNVKAEGSVKTEDKASRVKQELAFLGDEESDSD